MVEDEVRVFLDRVTTGNRKLDRFLKKKAPRNLRFYQLDYLAFNLYFYLKNNGLEPQHVKFTVRFSFSNSYLPVTIVKVGGFTQENPKRVSRSCFEALEERFYKDYEIKSEHEKGVVKKDMHRVFEAFLHSGFLLEEGETPFSISLLASREKRVSKMTRRLLSRTEKKTLNAFQSLNQKEEVLKNVG